VWPLPAATAALLMAVRPPEVNIGLPEGGTCNIRSQHTKDTPDGITATPNNRRPPGLGGVGGVFVSQWDRGTPCGGAGYLVPRLR